MHFPPTLRPRIRATAYKDSEARSEESQSADGTESKAYKAGFVIGSIINDDLQSIKEALARSDAAL